MEEVAKKRVCVIGAGASGLVAIRYISQSTGLGGTVFEGSSDVGGVWNYRPKSTSGTIPNGTLYKHMRTNQPKQLMGFPDFLYPDAFSTNPNQEFPAYLHHTQIREFLHSFANHFQLRQYIQFTRRVVEIRPIVKVESEESSIPKWRVTVQHTDDENGETSALEQFEFDAVLVCNGHLSKPLMPDIENIEEYKGTVLHSKDYDDAEPFVNKSVLIMGCGPSGVDIAFEVAEVASNVVLSNMKNSLKFKLLRNMKKVPRITTATHDGFICNNGEVVKCDAVIMCTGYVFDFPFLTPECGVTLEKNQRISPLYKDLVHISYPNLCFVGIQNLVNAFTLFDFQVRYCVNLFEGKFQLPSLKVMQEEARKEWELRQSAINPPPTASLSWSHQLGTRQWKYYETIAKEAQIHIPPFLPLFDKLYKKILQRRWNNARIYKEDKIYITNLESNEFCYVDTPEPTD